MHPRIPSFPLATLLTTGLILAAGCSGEATQAAPEGLGLVIQNPASERAYFVDFDRVKDGSKVSHTYELKNTDSVPVVIQDITPSCSCSSPVISYLDDSGTLVRGKRHGSPLITLPPGVTAKLEITIDTSRVRVKNVDKLATVMLRCDSAHTPYMHLELHLFVASAYQVTPKTIDLGNIPISSGKRGHADIITAVAGEQYRILGLLEESEGLEVKVVLREGAGGPLWQIQAILSPPLELGPWKGRVLLRSTDSDGADEGEPLELSLMGHVVPDVVMFPAVLGFNPASGGEGRVARGVLSALAPGHRIKVVDGLLQGDLPAKMTVSYEAKSPDSEGRSSSWDVAVESAGPIDSDQFTGIVQLTLENPDLDPIEVKFVYRRP